MKTYLAITIGPIYKTMQKAYKTREVWISSYLFSLIMEKLVAEAKNYGDIILPYPQKVHKDAFNGAGIFPDRLIMSLNNPEEDIQTKIIDKALKAVSVAISINMNLLKDYTQIYFIVIDDIKLGKFPFKDEKGSDENSFIYRLNFLLDNQELQARYNSSNEGFIKDLFDDSTRKKFYGLGFGNKRHSFPSIIEIAAKEKIAAGSEIARILDEDRDELDNNDQKMYDTFINGLDKHHKYMAILRADGDNFGKVIGAISSDIDKVKAFSKTLTVFSEKAAQIIADYGGSVIYIGGDDIVCFAPLVYGGMNIFDLVQKLNETFYAHFTDEIYKEAKVSLSYGVSLTYYKYPLNEALDLSYNLLFYKAKKYKPKNCIAFQLLQHSGQYRETILGFGDAYNSFLKMLGDFKDKEGLLQSLTHKFMEDTEILTHILPNDLRVDGYFENHFEEKKEQVKQFIDSVKKNFKATYVQMETHHSSLEGDAKTHFNPKKETLNQMNTICRILKFLSKNEQ